MERLHHMKESLMAQIQAQMGHLENVDAKELGEAIDMIKDLSEAIYYCTITEAMNEGSENGKGKEHEKEVYYYPMPMEPRYNPYGGGEGMGGGQPRYYENPTRMYYQGGQSSGGNSGNSSGSQGGRGGGNSGGGQGGNSGGRRNYQEEGYEYPVELRDHREGQSPKTRRMYMESKEMRHDKTVQIQELEQYMKELSSDVVEMIQGSSPEEKQLLKSKLTTLISKIDHA